MTDDLAARIARLRRKLAEASDPDDRADLAAAIAALEQVPTPITTTQTIGGGAQVGVAVGRDFHGNVYLNGMRGKTAEELMHGYLTRLAQHCGTLPLQGVREQRSATDVLEISLEQVYTQLALNKGLMEREVFNAKELGELTDFHMRAYLEQHIDQHLLPLAMRKRAWLIQQDIPDTVSLSGRLIVQDGIPFETIDLEVTSANSHILSSKSANKGVVFFGPQLATEAVVTNPRLVLLGEPGSGKSTALRYLALTLARAGLDELVDLPEKLYGWTHGRVLPIFMPLLPLAKTLAAQPNHIGNADDLWNAIVDHLQPKEAYPGLAAAVRDEMDAGRVLLMLDGLDEVVGVVSAQPLDHEEYDEAARKSARANVISAVHDFAAKNPACRIVVTCRIRTYEGEHNVAWQLPSWPTATLADWTLGQMHYFFDAWYTEAARANSMSQQKRDGRVANLKQAVENRDELRSLGKTPLLLTIMALVHLNDQQLPRDRVSLYSRCLDILLSQWEVAGKEDSEYGTLMRYIGLPDLKVESLQPLLIWAAATAHAASDGVSLGRIDRKVLRLELADQLAHLKHPNPHAGAWHFLHYTDARAGILHATNAGDGYAFPHQTFQEYLAGRDLVSRVGFVDEIMARRNDDRWRVPIFLGIGHAVNASTLSVPYQVFQRLLKMKGRDEQQRHTDVLLAAELAADVGWERLERGGDEYVTQREELAEALAEVVEGTALPLEYRIQAGELLGNLGDPRLGVCDLNIQTVKFTARTLLIDEPKSRSRCDDKGSDQITVNVAFELARYPVTNAQYALFIAANGYESKNWWDVAGRKWLESKKHRAPSEWNSPRFGSARPNHPVIGVNWYETTAFCRWLTQYLNDGYTYRLPSEAEWEYAARGTAPRAYPWGLELPDSERANFNQTINGTSVVGSFAYGATPEGLHDVAGNVWEWTASAHTPYTEGRSTPWHSFEDSVNKSFALRGGGWSHHSIILQASERGSFTPKDHFFYVGFRLARHLG